MDRAHETPTVEALDFTPHGADDIEEPHPRRTSYHDERDYERRRDSHYERDGRDRERDHQSSSGSHHHHHRDRDYERDSRDRERNDRDRGDRDRERDRDGGRDRERDRNQPDLYPPAGQALGSGSSSSAPVFPGTGNSGSNHHGHHDDRIEFERGDGARHGNDYNASSNANNNQDHPDQHR
ncbi:hypothetical protein BGZ73_005113, partial [Actinomortierella ambigua]